MVGESEVWASLLNKTQTSASDGGIIRKIIKLAGTMWNIYFHIVELNLWLFF